MHAKVCAISHTKCTISGLSGSIVSQGTITAVGTISTNGNISAGGNISSVGSISAGTTLSAGSSITATTGTITGKYGSFQNLVVTGGVVKPTTPSAQGI